MISDMAILISKKRLFKERHIFEEKLNKCCSPDTIAIKLVAGLVLGAWFLGLRVLAYGMPPRWGELMENNALALVIWWVIYSLAFTLGLLLKGLVQKVYYEVRIQKLDKRIVTYKCSWETEYQ